MTLLSVFMLSQAPRYFVCSSDLLSNRSRLETELSASGHQEISGACNVLV